jgi:thiol:disulfide interchange protein
MMKKVVAALLVLITVNSFAQMVNPAKWSFKAVQKNDKEAELIFTVKLDAGWHIYSQKEVMDGPLPTVFTFPKMGGYSLVGAVKEPSNGHPDKMWEEQGLKDVICYDGTVVFKQKIKILTPKKFELKGNVSYMVCKESCMPADQDFAFEINANATETSNEIEVVIDSSLAQNSSLEQETSKGSGIKPVSFRFIPKKFSETEYELNIRAVVDTGWFMSSKGDAKHPLRFMFELPNGVKLNKELIYPETNASGAGWNKAYKLGVDFKQRFTVENGDSSLMKKIKVTVSFAASNGKEMYESPQDASQIIDMSNAISDIDPHASTSFFWIFLTAFISGFAALLTPCVFPMIPMTVSFFLKRSKDRKKGIKNAMTYGFFIVAIYVALGLVVTAIFGSDSLNALSTNVVFNLFFFILLVVFAASFLGAFEIVLPNKWVNAADRGADKGGLIGIFFMAFTLALVSFSCTGPIVGTLLVQAAQQGGMGPFWGMFGFSLAIALPFTLFAIFPSWLNNMPSSGGWLNSVKVSLGFLELALALKFLSNADLVVKGHFLEREVFIALWVVIFALWGFYLLGKLKFSHDSDLPFITVPRLSMSILIFTFVMYLIPGMWGAPLKLINAFLPASTYAESPCGVGNICPDSDDLPEHADYGPNQIPIFHDYKYALEYSQKVKKPLMIDFTGHACVNCRQMENTVWIDEHVRGILSNDFVVVSLYVDEKTALPEKDQFVSAVSGKNIRTVGQKWSDFQIAKYKSNTQPQYFILDNMEATMNGSANFQDHGSPELFSNWLKQGIQQFKLFNGSKELRPELVLAN